MSGSIFLGNIHHAYAQTDGTYAFPNSREGDMLKQAVRELAAMREERDEARREVMSWIIDQACRSEDVDKEYKKRGWEYLKENTQ